MPPKGWKNGKPPDAVIATIAVADIEAAPKVDLLDAVKAGHEAMLDAAEPMIADALQMESDALLAIASVHFRDAVFHEGRYSLQAKEAESLLFTDHGVRVWFPDRRSALIPYANIRWIEFAKPPEEPAK